MLFKLAHFEDVNKNASAISTTLPILSIPFPHCKGHKRLTPIIIVSSSEMAEMSKKSTSLDGQNSNMSSLTAKIFRRRNRNR